AAEEGIHVSLDPNYRPDIWSNAQWAAKEVVNKALNYTDVAMFGYDEMLPLFGTEDHVQAARFLFSCNSRLEYVAIRLGSKGAYVANRNGEEVFSKAFKVQVVDTTGAGDAWAAGFIVFKLIEERSLEEATMLANAIAGIKCTKRGATSGMPRRSELEAFLREQGIKVDI
ncbi:MAG: PfkB family carbohydrate kinase, partial [Thermofilaceae archaeon]